MNRNKFNIGTYYLKPYACTDAHVKDLKECGIDFVVAIENNSEQLDLLDRYGIGAIVSGVVPHWWGGNGDNAGTMEKANPLGFYNSDNFKDHPAIWGINCGDEPSALDFPHCGEIVKKINSEFKNKLSYINIYPNYGADAENSDEDIAKQLRAQDYAQYIEKYCENVKTDYICYDFYVYSADEERAYENLRIVAEACKKNHRDMWIVLQVNSKDPQKYISENQLRFQAYTAMAFGVRTIMWACYTAGWWHNHVLDAFGNKTEQYDKLKKINAEIKLLAREYMKYQWVETHFVDNGSASFGKDMIFDFESDTKLVIGEMQSGTNDGSRALFICNADDYMDRSSEESNIRFKAHANEIRVINRYGEKIISPENGQYELKIKSNEGILIIAK